MSVGTATIDFGAFPGSTEAQVSVSGQTDITSTCFAEAWIGSDTSSDHTAEDHRYAPLFIVLTCSTPTDGVGFVIYARAVDRMQGTYTVRWVWAPTE